MRTRGRPGIFLVALASLLLTACSGKNEIVAEQFQVKPDATDLINIDAGARKCVPGHYEGTFTSAPTQAGTTPIPLSGTFSFDLEAPLQGEFHQLADNATLVGTASATFEFHATITGSADCYDSKSFSSKIENGTFSGGGAVIYFHGDVNGQYFTAHYKTANGMASEPVFAGAWQVFRTMNDGGVGADAQASTGPFLTGGNWSASLVSQ